MTENSNAGLLTCAEVAELTGKKRYKAQARALVRMGVRHVVRPNGSPVVARALVAAMLARYTEPPAAPVRRDYSLNLAALRTKRPRA